MSKLLNLFDEFEEQNKLDNYNFFRNEEVQKHIDNNLNSDFVSPNNPAFDRSVEEDYGTSNKIRDSLQERIAQNRLDAEESAKTIRGRMGWVTESTAIGRRLGDSVDLGAKFATGLSRNVGQIAQSALSSANNQINQITNFSEEELDLINRINNKDWVIGLHVSDDERAQYEKVPELEEDLESQVFNPINNPQATMSLKDRYEYAQKYHNALEWINDTADISSIANKTRTKKLASSVKKDFELAINDIEQGIKTFKDGDYFEGSWDIISSLASGLYSVGETSLTNKQAALEMMAENIPQVLLGATGAVAGLSMSGYGINLYNEGIIKYMKDNKGAYPSNEERQEMAAWAASAVLAEVISVSVLSAPFKKALSKVAGNVAKDAAKTSIVKTAFLGGAAEFPVEMWQEYAEGKIKNEDKSLADLLTAGTLGAITGSGISTIGAVAAKSKETNENISEAELSEFNEDVKNNNFKKYTEGSNFNPARAIGVLYENAKSVNDPIHTADNIKEANTIINNLETQNQNVKERISLASESNIQEVSDQINQLSERIDSGKLTPEQIEEFTEIHDSLVAERDSYIKDSNNIKALQATINRREKSIQEANKVMDSFMEFSNPTKVVTQEEVTKTIKQATEAPTEQSVNSVLNLPMSVLSEMPISSVNRLVKAVESSEGFSPEVLSNLRKFSEARKAENALKNMGSVSQEIYFGSDKNIGIRDYQERISKALEQGNIEKASNDLKLMNNFTQSHTGKALAAKDALDKSIASGKTHSIVRDLNGSWNVISTRPTKAQREDNGALSIFPSSTKLISNIEKEANALNTIYSELEGKVNAKTNRTVSQQTESSTGEQVQARGTEPSTETQITSEESKLETVTAETEITQQVDQDNQSLNVVEEGLETDQTKEVSLINQELNSLNEEPSIEQLNEIDSQISEDSSNQFEEDYQTIPQDVIEESIQDLENREELSIIEEERLESLKSIENEVKPEIKKSKELPTGNPISALSESNREANKDSSFMESNLVSKYGVISSPSKTGESSKPLALIPNLITNLINDNVSVKDFLAKNKQNLSSRQVEAFQKFINYSSQWRNVVPNLIAKGNENYRYNNPFEFFINEDGSIDENVSTAISYGVFSWIAENGSTARNLSDEDINKMLGRNDNDPVSDDLRAILNLSFREADLANELGTRIINVLGLRTKADAPIELESKLASGLGVNALALLHDQGIIEFREIDLSNYDTGEHKTINAYVVSRDGSDVNAVAKDILESQRGTNNILASFFGSEAQVLEPSFEPIPFTNVTAKNTTATISKTQREVLIKDQNTPWKLNQDMFNVFSSLGTELMLDISGYNFNDINNIHIENRESYNSKNRAIENNLDNLFGFINDGLANSKDGLNTPIYFSYEVWKNVREGMNTRTVNPQNSKIDRYMFGQETWIATIDPSNESHMEDYKLRVADSFGIRTDKQSNERSIKELDEIISNPLIISAVDSINELIQGNEISQEEMRNIADISKGIKHQGIKFGGEGVRTLDGLVALSAMYRNSDPTAPFQVNMLAEVDGVNNGPIISTLLFGTFLDQDQMFTELNRGGIFELGSKYSAFNTFKEDSGSLDLYETTMQSIYKNVITNTGNNSNSALNFIYSITGNLVTDGTVTSDGRSLGKDALVPVNFGSSTRKAIDGVGRTFLSSIYKKIEKLSKDMDVDGLRDLKNNLNNFTQDGLFKDIGLDVRFTDSQKAAVLNSFYDNFGQYADEALAEIYVTYNQRKNALTGSSNLLQILHQSVIDAEIKTATDNDINIDRTAKGLPRHGLTKKQTKKINDTFKFLKPMIHSSMSAMDNDIDSGLLSAKSGTKNSDKGFYRTENRLNNPINSKTVTVHGLEYTSTSPEILMTSANTHSTDASIMSRMRQDNNVLNLFDAAGGGVLKLNKIAHDLNKATWDSILHYSPLSEAKQSLYRSLRGMNKYLERTDTNTFDQAVSNIKYALDEFAKKSPKNERGKNSSIVGILRDIVDQANQADDIKYGTMEVAQYINQYALEKGVYEVTDADRAKASDLRAKIDWSIPEDVMTIALNLDKLLGLKSEQASQQPKTKPTPQTTTTPVHDPSLALREGTYTVKEVWSELRNKLRQSPNTTLNTFTNNLMKAMNSSVKDVEVVVLDSVEFLKLPNDSVPDNLSHGWFNLKNGKGTVYLLGQEFENSLLTPEIIIHELVHASLATKIQNYLDGKTLDSKEKQSIENIINIYETVKTNPLAKDFSRELENIHEFISYGLSNQKFQTELLSKVEVQANKMNLTSALRKFITETVNAVFSGLGLNNNVTNGNVNALASLVAHSIDLMNQNPNTQAQGELNFSMSVSNNSVKQAVEMTPEQLFDVLDDGSVSKNFQDTLKTTLSQTLNKLYGAFGIDKVNAMNQMAMSPFDVFLKSRETGNKPFISDLTTAPFKISEQEMFIAEQLEAVLRESIEGNQNASITNSFTEISNIYKEAKDNLTPASFLDVQWDTATNQEQELAQQKYDFLFGIEGNKLADNYLSRFASLVSSVEQINDLVNDSSSILDLETNDQVSKINQIIDKISSWFINLTEGTKDHETKGTKLNKLIDNLVGIEAKRRRVVANRKEGLLNNVENTLNESIASARQTALGMVKKPFLRESPFTPIRAISKITTIVSEDRANLMMEGITKVRDEHFKGVYGTAMATINYMKAPAFNLGTLLQKVKHNERLKIGIQIQTSKAALESFIDNGSRLSQKTKDAITNVFMRSDAQSLLGTYSFNEITEMVNSKELIESEMNQYETKLENNPNYGFLLVQGKALGYMMATGKATISNLYLSPEAIVEGYSKSTNTTLEDSKRTELVNLVSEYSSLNAINYSKTSDKNALIEVMTDEGNRLDGGNGLTSVMYLHRNLLKDSKERLFRGSELLVMKGYVPDITNQNTKVVYEDMDRRQELEDMGYKFISVLPNEVALVDKDRVGMFILRDGGDVHYASAIMSIGSLTKKGTSVNSLDKQIKANESIKQYSKPHDFDPTKVSETHSVPVINSEGNTVGFRYMMQNNTKDTVLERQNSFDQLLGSFASSTFNKESATKTNSEAVGVLKEIYDNDFSSNSSAFVELSAYSKDPEMREIWKILPKEVKNNLTNVWGRDRVMVKKDVIDIMFGYRKYSLSNIFEQSPSDRKGLVKLFANMSETILRQYSIQFLGFDLERANNYAKRAGNIIRKGERVLQELVGFLKDTVVIKTLAVVVGNEFSNNTVLFMNGVPLKDIVKYKYEGVRATMKYQREASLIDNLKAVKQMTEDPLRIKEIDIEIDRIQKSLDMNPVAELFNDGLMPTIVDDISMINDPYSYKGLVENKFSSYADKLPDTLKNVGKFVFMARDTTAYKFMHQSTQLSDFVSRYTLHKYLTDNPRKGMTKQDIRELINDSFVNYDVPLPKGLQYLDDTYILPFTKYFLSIQRVLFKLMKDKPARVLSTIMLNNYFEGMDTVMNSSMLTRVGNNPLYSSVTNIPEAVGNTMMIKPIVDLIK